MKNKSMLNIITFTLITIVLIGCNNSDNTKAIDELLSDERSEENFAKLMGDNDYVFEENISIEDKSVYSKKLGDDVNLDYSDGTYKEFDFVFIRDGKQNNFILTKIYNGEKYIYSIDNSQDDTILIEKELYRDCTIDKCVTDNDNEIYYEHYTYNIKTKELTPKGDIEASIELKDIQSDIDAYLTELTSLY